jgi:valyl-tRNA synthetase
MELSPQYEPKEVENRWYQHWESRGYFRSDTASQKPPFCIVIPPPNVTGSLHMGHALDNTLQDLIIRYKRMCGFDALWVPGTDHGGIATFNVVEKELAKEGKRRDELGREKFVERVWQWKELYGATILKQLRRLGVSCDWSYERFTMDEGLSRAVTEAFVRLYEEGSIYQGDYVINWCPRCGTALSEIEVEHKEALGKLYHVRYPVEGKHGRFVTVATTRPETIPGDEAVAVNPEDGRYASLHGGRLVLPLFGKVIPLLVDPYVDKAFGTGALKVTPAHDANDFALGEKYGLARPIVMDPQGVMNGLAGAYAGLDRFKARKAIVADLEKAGLLAKVEDYTHAVGRCYRCTTVVESYLSKQWFMRMKPLAEEARKAVEEGRTTITPGNWTKVYTDWLDNIRDWCISRQIWWGHRIPVYYHPDGRKAAAHSAAEAARKLQVAEADLKQDEDVLDTWFSSALWPFSTLGWPDKTPALRRYYPTSVLVTGWEILIIWVSKMSMFGLKLAGGVPFQQVLIHSIVADEHGQKMSKSKGNVVDPLEEIDDIGADALRFTLCLIESQTRYVSLSEDKLELGRNFMNKIWNAARFMLLNLKGFGGPAIRPSGPELSLADRWVLARLDLATEAVQQALDRGWQVNAMATTLLEFFWHELCDWYIEAAKTALQSDGPERRRVQQVLAFTLEQTLRLLHPLCPFITEEIWQLLPHEGETIMQASWPKAGEPDQAALEEFGFFQQAVYGLRNLRAERKVEAAKTVPALVQASGMPAKVLEGQKAVFEMLTRTRLQVLTAGAPRPERCAAVVAGGASFFLPLAELLDLEAEKGRLAKEIARHELAAEALERKLANAQFTAKAPAEVVGSERKKMEVARETAAKLREALRELEAG